MSLKKKGQGLSLSTIIVAILAILVLLVLTVIFTGKMSSTKGDMEDCEGAGGVCISADEGCSSVDGVEANGRTLIGVKMPGKDCEGDMICCT